MNQIHPQDFSSQKEKEKKRIHPVNGGRRRIRSSAIRSRDFFPRVQPALGDCRRRMTAQVILSIPTSKKLYRLARLDERIQPTNDPAARRSLSSTSFAGYIYTKLQLVMRPWKRMGTRSMRDTGHSLHPRSPTTLWIGLQAIGSIETSNLWIRVDIHILKLILENTRFPYLF